MLRRTGSQNKKIKINVEDLYKQAFDEEEMLPSKNLYRQVEKISESEFFDLKNEYVSAVTFDTLQNRKKNGILKLKIKKGKPVVFKDHITHNEGNEEYIYLEKINH